MENSIIIPDNIFSQIMTCMGGSFLEEGDLEISNDDIKNTIIIQAMKEYYRWFPIETYSSQDVSGPFEIPFPESHVFSVKDVRINTMRMNYRAYGNALVDERFIRSSTQYGRAMYGTRNDYGMTAAKIINRFEKQSFLESNKAFKWRVIENLRKIKGFSNTLATMEITWASWSDDWQYVAFSQERDVIKLAQAYILRFFGELRSQDEVDGAPVTLQSDKLIERAATLEEDVMTKWKQFAYPIFIK